MYGTTRKHLVEARGALACIAAALVVLAAGVALTIGTRPVNAAPVTMQGAWMLTPATGGHPAGFQLLSCFAAGGVYTGTDSSQPGTALGQWSRVGTNGFEFTYLVFHFGPNGKHTNTVRVRATGTFHSTSLVGRGTHVPVDPYGRPGGPPSGFTFTGKRIASASS